MGKALELIRLGRAKVLVLGGAYYRYQGQRRPDSELLEVWIRGWGLPTGELIPLGICTSTRDEAERVGELARVRGWSGKKGDEAAAWQKFAPPKKK